MEKNDIDFHNYIRVLKKRRSTVYTFFAVVMVLTIVGTFASTPLYMASTKVLIEKQEPTGMLKQNSSSEDPEFYWTQYELIRSVAVARKVVEMLALEKTYDTYLNKDRSFSILGSIGYVMSKMFGLISFKNAEMTEAETAERINKLAKKISEEIEVTPVKNTRIVDIRYMSPNPELSKLIVNTVAKAYIEQVLELNMSSTRHTVEWMSKKAEEERVKLETAEKTLQQYSKAQNFITLENKIAIIPQKIGELNSQLIRSETKRKEMETLYNKVKDAANNLDSAETMSVIASDMTVQSLRQQILKAEQNIMEMSQKYGKKHPVLLRAVEDLNILKNKREKEILRVVDSVKNEYDLARANESSLRRMLGESKGEALNINEKYFEYATLNRDVETNRQMYDALMKRIKEQNIAERGQTVNLLIVEKAESPKKPARPRKLLNLVLGIFLGMVGGIGMALFIEYIDHTVKSPEETEIKVGAPVFGTIPFANLKGQNIESIVMNEPLSAFSENYKAIRASLLLSSAERPPKRILITSSGPGEGKTVTSINLGMAITQAGHSVLLIDCDLRKPRVHTVFKLNNAKGLSTYLAGASDMDIVQDGPMPNFSIVPSGPIPPNPSELLSSPRLREMINALNDTYDFILCDSPPLLSVADSLSISRILDGTLIVARAGATTYEDLKKGIKSLASVNAHLLGIIINAIDVRKSDYRYYQRQYYAQETTVKTGKK